MPLRSFSQDDLERQVSLQLKQLQQLFEQEQAKIPEISKTESDSSLLVFLSKLKNDQEVFYNSDAYYEAYQNLLKKDYGLNLNIDGVQNFNVTQQDMEENILYQRRYQAGLEWNVLKGGYFDSRAALKGIPAQQAYEQQIAYYQNLKKNSGIKMNQCIYWFNTRKMAVLKQRQDLLNQEMEVLEKLYFAKKISKEHLLKNQTRLAEINGMKGIYEAYNQYISPQFDSTLLNAPIPLFDLNYEILMNDYTENTGMDSVSRMLLDQFELQNKWFREIRVKASTKYNYYDLLTTNPNSRSFFNVGLSVSMPLPFSYKEQHEFEVQKVNKQIDQIKHALENKKIETLNEAYEFRYQLKQYIIFHQKRILVNEGLRQERVKAKLLDADFNPLHALELLDDLMQIDIELLDLKQNLYIKLVKIQEKLPHVSIEQLIVPLSLPNYFDFEDETNRNVYVWTKAFELHSVEFISEYLIYNQIDGIQLAVAKEDKYIEQKKKLIAELQKNNIQVQLMIGQNELMDSPDFAAELQSLIQTYDPKSIAGIHLDIEPHTRSDWKTNKEKLMEHYKVILKETKTRCDTYAWKLSIDLPLSLDSVYVNDLITQVDQVRFMCYENVKEDYLLRKLAPYASSTAKLVVALRTEDFRTRNELEEFAKNILSKTHIPAINFHDLNRLIELDKKSMTQQNEEH